MPDRASVFQLTQIGPETTPGTVVTPSKRLASMGFELTPDPSVNVFRPSGYLWPTVGATNYEETKFSMKGQGVFDELPYLYNGAFVDVSPTTPGGATNTRQWDYSLSTLVSNTKKTYTAEAGDNQRGMRAGYMQFAEAGWTIDLDKGMQLTGGGFAQKMLDAIYVYILRSGSPTTGTWSLAVTAGGSTQTASALSRTITASALQTALEALSNVGVGQVTVTGGPLGTAGLLIKWGGTLLNSDSPTVAVTNTFDTGSVASYGTNPEATALPLVPITGPMFDVYTATSQSGLGGATALTRAFNLEFKAGNLAVPVKPLGTANNGTYAGTVEAVPTGTFKFSVGADSSGMSFLQKLRANTKVFVRVKATGPTIESGQTYYFQQDMCLILNKPSALKDGDSLLQMDFEGVLSHDATWGKALSAQIKNTLTAL